MITTPLCNETDVTQLRQENADLRAKLAAAVRVVATAYPTTADEMNAVIRKISEITHLPAPEDDEAFVWSGYDDDERGFGLFETREAAQAYAEYRYREDWVNWGNAPDEIVEIGWSERKAYTDAHDGRPGMFDLHATNGRTGYVVHEAPVHATADTAIQADSERDGAQ